MTSSEYVPIRITTLRGDIQIGFDVYVKVGAKYIHYIRRGASFEGERLERLKSKKLKDLYIRRDDESAYQKYLTASLDAAYAPGRPLRIRAEVIQGFQQAASEHYMENPMDHASYDHVRDSAKRFVNFLEEEPFGAGALLEISNVDHSVSQHAVNVAALAVGMVLHNGPPDGTPIHLLALGCLLHDIEHVRSNWPVTKSPADLSPEDRRVFEQHPVAGARRLQGAQFVDQLVVNIIAQHEETADGSGFPQRLKANEMDPLVLVAGAANAYDRLVSFEGQTPAVALKAMLIDKMGEYPLEMLKTLQAVLKKHDLI